MRIRFRFSKQGKIRFTSQRDVARMWERALRRARLPMAYTEGFSPRPQLSFGLALPTGCESLAEYLDVALDDQRPETAGLDVGMLPSQLTGLLPAGMVVQDAMVVDRRIGSLQQQVTSCSWTMTFDGMSRVALAARVEALMSAPSVLITRERKGRQERDDLRPSVIALAVVDGGRGPEGETEPSRLDVVAELATQPRGVRPVELVRGLIAVGPGAGAAGALADGAALDGAASRDGMGGEPELVRACRTQQWIERDGARWEPLQLGGGLPEADRAMHALERAS